MQLLLKSAQEPQDYDPKTWLTKSFYKLEKSKFLWIKLKSQVFKVFSVTS